MLARMVAPTTPPPPLPSPVLDRSGTSSRKLRGPGGAFLGRDVLPMWIADMEFSAPQVVVDAVVERAKHGVYGYTDCPEELTRATLRRLSTIYASAAPPDASWLLWKPGLVPLLNHAVRACCAHGADDAVVVATPIYPPFLSAVSNNGARLVRLPLAEARGGDGGAGSLRYEIDWAATEAALRAPQTKLLLWCNPHNPSGRCWSRADLARLARLCVAHDVILCSDEVWGEVPLDAAAAPFTSCLALLAPDGAAAVADDPADAAAAAGVPGLRERLLVLTSPSKCFNVATLDIALAVAPHAPLLQRLRGAARDAAEVPPLGYSACLAAYTAPAAEAWRLRLCAYLRANRDHALAALAPLPGVRVCAPEASYLLWLDAAGALPAGAASAYEHLLAHGVGLSDGADFGAPPGCARLNLACAREELDEGLRRIRAALAPDAEDEL